jgi:hypothetical protein
MTGRPVHLAMPCPHPHLADCAGPVPCKGADICRPAAWARTADPVKVTCARCLISPAYREPLPAGLHLRVPVIP